MVGSGNQELKATGAHRRRKQRPGAAEMGVPSSLVHPFTQLAGEVKPCHKPGYLPITFWCFIVISKARHGPYLI